MATKKPIILAKELVKPSSPTPHNLNHHKFSLLDQNIVTPSYIPFVFFYPKDTACSPNTTIDQYSNSKLSLQLKQSLSDSLTKFYPLAGKLDKDKDHLCVDCDDSGALFVEAQVDAPLSQAIFESTTTNLEELDQYLPTKPHSICGVTNWEILLAVQVNFFECGGVAIGACISHKVADLLSSVTFLNAWAAACRGSETAQILQPNFDFGWRYFPPVNFPPKLPFSLGRDGDGDGDGAVVGAMEKITTKRFLFDKQTLLKLKALAIAFSASNSNAEVIKDPSRVEVVSAFIYKQLIEVNRAKVNPKGLFSFSHSVNLRARMKQHNELPPNEFAFGNLSPMFLSTLFTYEKVEKFHDLVSAMRSLMRKLKDDHQDDHENLLKKVKSTNDDIMAVFENPDVLHFHFTSLCKIPFSQVDYGWGKPLVVWIQPLPAKNTVIVMDTTCGEGIQAFVTLADEEIPLLPNELLSLENNDFTK